jgi:uncharacterized protein
LIYLDSAAAVKLVHTETESDALRRFLDERPDLDWVSSALLEVETFRALARATVAHDMPTVINDFHTLLDFVARIEIDPGIRIVAQTLCPTTVRSLDAIHLATALRLQDQGQLTSFVTYDKRLADAAVLAGLAVETPTD